MKKNLLLIALLFAFNLSKAQVINSFPYLENFEDSLMVLGKLQQSQQDIFNWSPNRGFTMTANTGPSADHTTGSGTYIYTESSFPRNPGDSAIIESDSIDISGLTYPFLDFYYHLWGSGMGDLALEIDSAGTWKRVWLLSGNQGNAWQKGKVNLSGFKGIIRYRFVGIIGSNRESDLAIDDILLYDSPAFDDLKIEQILLPRSSCDLDSSESIGIKITNLGTDTLNNIPVSFEVKGNPLHYDTILMKIAPNSTFDFYFDEPIHLANEQLYEIECRIYLSSDNDLTNNTLNDEVVHFSIQNNFPFQTSWENGNNGFYALENTSFDLGIPAGNLIDTASNGQNAWVTNLLGNYQNNENGFVQSPCFDFSNLSFPVLEMDIWWDIETNFDGSNISYTLDSGQTWQVLGNVNSGINWYNQSSVMGFPINEPVWNGDDINGSNAWLRAKQEMKNLAGEKNVQFRIHFYSDESVNYEGFAFDNFRIYDAVEVTFKVDMIYENTANTVHLSGLSADLIPLTKTNNEVWEVKTSLEKNNTIAYQFINGNAISGAEILPMACATNGMRTAQIGNLDTVLNLVCFGECSPCDSAIQVTFKVNMSKEMVDSTGVFLTGNFRGQSRDTILLNNSGNNIWESALAIPFNENLEYHFLNGKQKENVPMACETNGNRTIQLAKTDTILPLVCFSECQDCSVGIENINLDVRIKVYPNPTQNDLNLVFDFKTAQNIQVKIYNSLGKKVLESNYQNIQKENLKFNLENQSSGIYFLEILFENEVINLKIVKN